ncbi:MAG TPA: D-2-hydroxyacid dehydrogenase family protein [Acidimicrobiales bacterium]|jgi:phosphoglycerate dehydrogenase-like enzyme|nr:D-2-hydroxyacid dehydrogenase family protein [Acidimicrobiales bacterium]
MKQVVVLDDYQGVATEYADWSRLDGRVELTSLREHIVDEDALVERLHDVEIVVAMRERTAFPRSIIARLPKLELLVTTGPFNAVIDTSAATEHGVTVCGTGGAIFNTAELTWALILACARHVPTEDRNLKRGGWMTTVGTDLHGKTLALCGLGRLGGIVAGVGKAFGMEVIAWSQNLTDKRAAEAGARLVEKDELFAAADVLSIHLVLSERTRGLVGEPELALMKPTAILVNTSRGPIVDEDALARTLEVRGIRSAGIDVFAVEPLPADHPFRRLDNIVTTPHLGYVTEDCYRIFFGDIVEDIAAYLDGAPIRLVVPAPN